MTTKEQLRAAAVRRVSAQVEIGGQVFRLQEMTAGQSDGLFTDWAEEKKKANGGDNYRRSALLLTRCIVDENGAPIFGAEDLADILDWSRSTIDALTIEALKVNGMSVGDEGEPEKN